MWSDTEISDPEYICDSTESSDSGNHSNHKNISQAVFCRWAYLTVIY